MSSEEIINWEQSNPLKTFIYVLIIDSIIWY